MKSAPASASATQNANIEYSNACSNETFDLSDDNEGARLSWRDAARVALPFWLWSRLWVFAWVYAGHWNRSPGFQVNTEPIPGAWTGVSNWWLNPWTTYDTQWFMQIARDGYDARSVVFFPLYPLVLRLAGTDENTIALWGFVFSNVCFAAALVLFYLLTRRYMSEKVARRAVAIMAFFPTAAVWSALYTESLFLLLVLAMFYALHSQRLVAVGILGFLAALTRNSGPLLWVVLMIEYSTCYRSKPMLEKSSIIPIPTARRIGHLLLLSTPLMGFIFFQWFISTEFGDSRAMFHAQETFGREWQWPWLPIWNEFLWLPDSNWEFVRILNLGATLLGLYIGVRFWRRQPVSHSVFILGIELSQLCLGYNRGPFTLGAARYMATTFPFAQRLSLWIEPVLERPLGRWCLIGLMLAASAHMSFLFGQKVFLF